MKSVLFAALFFLHPLFFGVAAAQAWPAKPVRVLVGFTPGGTNDILAHVVADSLTGSLHQPVQVENRPGAAGLVAAEAVAKAPADGYTLLLGSAGSQTVAPQLARKLAFDPLKAFAPVTLVGTTAGALAVRPTLPAQSVRELVTYAKRRPGLVSFASSGNGTTAHLAGLLFKEMAEVELVHVSFNGNAPALADLAAGKVDMMFSALPPLLPLAREGKIRILGVASADRLPSLPNVPTVAEQGMPGFESGSWYGLFVRAGTPDTVIERLAAEVGKALREPKTRKALVAEGVEPRSAPPAKLGEMVRADYARWGKVIRESDIRAD